MKVKVEKFPIRHNGNKYNIGEIFDIDKKEAEKLLEKGYISVVEADEETIEEEKMEITEEEIENSELPKKKKTNKNK